MRTLIYLLIFIGGLVIGAAFPSYSLQYKQRILAQYDQVQTDLAPFQGIADKYHGGSMAALVRYHLASTDPTFHDEGLAIQMMVSNHAELASATAALDASLFEQLRYLLQQSDQQVAADTWKAYTPVLVSTEPAMVFALSVALICCACVWLLWSATALLFRRS